MKVTIDSNSYEIDGQYRRDLIIWLEWAIKHPNPFGKDGTNKIIGPLLDQSARFKFEFISSMLRSIADKEIKNGAGISRFGPWPARWFERDKMKWRCLNDHVSDIKEHPIHYTNCLGCGADVFITFPEDQDGPLYG